MGDILQCLPNLFTFFFLAPLPVSTSLFPSVQSFLILSLLEFPYVPTLLSASKAGIHSKCTFRKALTSYRPVVLIKAFCLFQDFLRNIKGKACSCSLSERACQGIANSLLPIPRNPPKESTAYAILPSSRSIINSSIFPRFSPAY